MKQPSSIGAAVAIAIAVAIVLTGCPKDDAAKADGGAAPAASSAAPHASASASASAAPAGASYEGKYTATPGALYIPSEDKDYKGVKQAKDDGTKMVGDGTFTLAVDPAGRVSGTIESGPAQGSVIEGVVESGNLTATVRVKSPGEQGLHGSLTGKVTGDAVEGTMTLADTNASTLRDAKFTAKKTTPAAH